MVTLLYPFFVDHSFPQSTIAKEVGSRIDGRVLGFAREDSSVPDSITPIRISGGKIKKTIHFSLSYFRDVDVIHTAPCYHNAIAQLGKILRQARIVHTLHATHLTGGMKRIRNRLVRNATRVTAVSEHVAQNSKWSVDTVVPNGVDFERFGPKKTNNRGSHLLYVGRLDEQKNAGMLVDIAQETEQRIEVYGDGILRSKLEKATPDNVRFHGRIPRDELPAKYAAADVMLCPHENEGFGMAALESLASGTPVVALRSGAFPEFIDDENGTLVDSLDPQKWLRAIDTTADIDESTVRDSVRQYQWKHIARQYATVYNDLV